MRKHISKDDIKTEVKDEIVSFKKFIFKKNMLEFAIAVIIGGAFNKVVSALSSNILMPIVNFALSKTQGDWRKYSWSPWENLNLEIGSFLGHSIDFLITGLCLYIIYIKILKPLFVPTSADMPKATKKCKFCYEDIAIKATRCSRCTSNLV
jgi:large conductance mechanosensitive channel